MQRFNYVIECLSNPVVHSKLLQSFISSMLEDVNYRPSTQRTEVFIYISFVEGDGGLDREFVVSGLSETLNILGPVIQRSVRATDKRIKFTEEVSDYKLYELSIVFNIPKEELIYQRVYEGTDEEYSKLAGTVKPDMKLEMLKLVTAVKDVVIFLEENGFEIPATT